MTIQKYKIHSSDIKDIIYDKKLITCSRDGRIIILGENFEIEKEYNPNVGFINTLATYDNHIFAGTQSGLILHYFEDQLNYLSFHKENVTALKIVKDNVFGVFNDNFQIPHLNFYLVSGSWDKNVCIFNFFESKIKVFNFDQGIWDLLIYNNLLYVCGVDKMIHIFQNGYKISVLNLHTSCVRSMTIFNGNLISLSNYGKIIKWDNDKMLNFRDLKILSYRVKSFKESIVVSGEKMVLILDKNLNVIKKINLGVECWSLINIGNNICIGGSDGILYVLDIKNFKEMSVNISIEKEIDETDLRDKDVKIENNNLYKNVDGEWVFVGSLTNNEHTFQVEVEGKYLSLTFNDNENTYEIAERFLRKHKLSDNYKQDIINFIRNNFRKKEKYYIYDSINFNGIIKHLDKKYESLIGLLENLDENYIIEIENYLSILLKEELFIALDIYRYLVAKEISVDLGFLPYININHKKEAIAFTRLVTNLYPLDWYNLEIFRNKIRGFYDCGFVSQKDIDYYEKNREISNNNNKK